MRNFQAHHKLQLSSLSVFIDYDVWQLCIFSFSIQEDEKTAKDLDFWLEDLYTPGFDSLLKKKEAEKRRNRLCKILWSITVSVCVLLVVILVPVVVLKQKNWCGRCHCKVKLVVSGWLLLTGTMNIFRKACGNRGQLLVYLPLEKRLQLRAM